MANLQVGSLSRTDVRVPLDVARVGGDAPLWRPARVLELEMNVNRDVVRMLDFCQQYMRHCNGVVMPLLVDEKIHYKMLMFM